MEKKKTDRRVQKTRRAIRRAFVQMLSRKELDSITVTDIAEAADINRKTFYNYYSGVADVLAEIEDELVTAFRADLQEYEFGQDVEDVRQMFSRLWELIAGDQEFYHRLFHQGKDFHLIEKLTEMLRERSLECYLAHGGADPQVVEIVVDFVVSGVMSVQKHWFVSGQRMPLDQLCRIMTELAKHGSYALLSGGADQE